MTGSDRPFSLSTLQHRLDNLRVGEQLTIARATYRRLFGPNDLGEARLRNFAVGHGCKADEREESITFHKLRP